MIFLYILSSHFALTTFVQTSWQTHRKLLSRASIQCVSCDAAEMRTASSTCGSLHLCSDTTKRYPSGAPPLQLFVSFHHRTPLFPIAGIFAHRPIAIIGRVILHAWMEGRCGLKHEQRCFCHHDFYQLLLREVRKIFGQLISIYRFKKIITATVQYIAWPWHHFGQTTIMSVGLIVELERQACTHLGCCGKVDVLAP